MVDFLKAKWIKKKDQNSAYLIATLVEYLYERVPKVETISKGPTI